MGWTIYTDRIDGDGDGEPPWKKSAPPISRIDAALRWIFFIPCAVFAYFVTYYTLLFMGEGAWSKWFEVGHRVAPSPPYLYTLFFCIFAAGIAGLMGLSLGALTAPAHRGLVGLALLLGLFAFDTFAFMYSQRHGHYRSLMTILLESAANLTMGFYTLRGMVRVYGWRGRSSLSAAAYWNPKPAPKMSRPDS